MDVKELRKRFHQETGEHCMDNLAAYAGWLEQLLVNSDENQSDD